MEANPGDNGGCARQRQVNVLWARHAFFCPTLGTYLPGFLFFFPVVFFFSLKWSPSLMFDEMLYWISSQKLVKFVLWVLFYYKIMGVGRCFLHCIFESHIVLGVFVAIVLVLMLTLSLGSLHLLITHRLIYDSSLHLLITHQLIYDSLYFIL